MGLLAVHLRGIRQLTRGPGGPLRWTARPHDGDNRCMDWRRLHRPPRGATSVTIISAVAAVVAIVLIYASLLGFGQVPFTVAMYIAVVAILLAVWTSWRRS